MKHDDTELSQEQTPQEQLAEAPTQPQKFFVVDYRDLAEIRVAEFSYLEAAQAACPAEGGASVRPGLRRRRPRRA